jgi:hypothetical protein
MVKPYFPLTQNTGSLMFGVMQTHVTTLEAA